MPKSYYYIHAVNVIKKNDFIQIQHLSFKENKVSR